jgi:hypothetical protein
MQWTHCVCYPQYGTPAYCTVFLFVNCCSSVFSLSCGPSWGSSPVLWCLQLVCQLAWQKFYIWGGADKSFARPTSRCRRTEFWKSTGFRLNQYLSNWASHVSALGSSFMKIWTCGMSQGGLVLARQCPGSPGTCNPDETGLQCLDHTPYSLDLAQSDYHLFPGLKKQL